MAVAMLPQRQLIDVVLLAYAAGLLRQLRVLEVSHFPPGVVALLRKVLRAPQLHVALSMAGYASDQVCSTSM